MLIKSPLSVPVSRNKSFTLNLNYYRNCHYQVLNKAKINYKAIIHEQIKNLPVFDKVEIIYTLYPKTKRLTDLDNILSIHAKFFSDALVEYGKLTDDNYTYITKNTFVFGKIDKINSRVGIRVVPVTEI